MRQLFLFACLLFSWVPAYGSPLQSLLGDNTPDDGGFLPVEQAFVVSASLKDANTIQVKWEIADGYYLYRHQLRFQLANPAQATLGEARLPDGKKKTDEYFGEIEAYYHRLDVEIPLTLTADGADEPLMLQARFQGCAERGLCYPPETVSLPLLPAGDVSGPATGAPGMTQASPGATPTASEQDRLAGLIAGHNLLLVGLAFFGFGLLLAFTPCVLPMLPILSGIIAGAGERTGVLRGLSLAASYVFAMALAYTVFGVVAGLTGANLQAAMQNPWVIGGFSALFVALALSMFGLYELQLPNALQSRVASLSNRQQGGSLVGAAIMGFLSALIVGPCLAPPLAGALLYISNTGDALLGGWALFALGMGMGTPLLALGVVEGGLLPRAGHWMHEVKHLFGFMLLGVAVWMLSRVLPPMATTALWLLFTVSLVGYLLRTGWRTRQSWRYGLALVVAVYAGLLLHSASHGPADPFKPWQGLVSQRMATADRLPFLPIKSVDDLQLMLAEAQRQERPVILDFYADWCVACVKMEHEVFTDPQVRSALGNILLLRADVTANDEQDRTLLKSLGVYGPPTVLFFSGAGAERADLRITGETDSAGFLDHLQRLDNR